MEISPSDVGTKTSLYDSWTPDRKNATAPKLERSYNFSNKDAQNSYALEDGSYFRNKSLLLGYSFPKTVLTKMKLEKLRIYVQVVNLFTITNYKGLDPELSRSTGFSLNDNFNTNSFFGIDAGNFPNNQKQFLIGVNLGF